MWYWGIDSIGVYPIQCESDLLSFEPNPLFLSLIYHNHRLGWLDGLIAAKKRSEKVDTMLAVVCCTLHIADNAIQSRYNSFRAALERYSHGDRIIKTLTVSLG